MSPADPSNLAVPFAAIPEVSNGRAQFTRVQALSLTIHVAVLVLLIAPVVPVLFITAPTQAKSGPWVHVKLTSPFPRRAAANGVVPHGGGGGGESWKAPFDTLQPPFAVDRSAADPWRIFY